MSRRRVWSGTPKNRWHALAVAAICLLPFALALLVLLETSHPVITPDSAGYLRWATDRTSPYPTFLSAVGLRQVVPVQLVLLASSLALLAYVIHRCFGSLLVSAALVVGIVANPEIWALQTSVLSEALTTPLLVMFVAALVVFVTERRAQALVWAALAGSLAAVARPSLLPIIAIPPAAAYLVRAKRAHGMAALCLAIIVLCIGVDRFSAYAIHGPNRTSLLGRHLFAKSALIEIGSATPSFEDPLEQRLGTLAQADYAPVRQTLAKAPYAVRAYLREAYEVCFQYACTDQLLSGPEPAAQKLRAQFNVGFERSLQNPAAMVAMATDEYVSMWAFHPETSAADALRAFKAEYGPLPFEQQLIGSGLREDVAPSTVPERAFRAGLILTGWACVITLAFSLIMLLRSDRRAFVILGFLSSLAVQMILIFDSFAGVGIPRYVMGIWPLIVLSVVCSLVCVTPLLLAERPFRGPDQ